MDEAPKRRVLRLSWIVWPVVIIVAVFVIDLVRDYYLNGDALFSPEEIRQQSAEISPNR